MAQNFIQQLKNIAVDQEPRVLSYLYEAKKTKRLVDEANEITQAVRPQDNLRFELDSVSPVLFLGFPESDFLPHLVVRVVRVLTQAQRRWKGLKDHVVGKMGHNRFGSVADALQTNSQEPSELLFVWSVSKFMGRLDMMRDIYHNWMSGISFTVDLREDPWVEAGPVELDFWMKEKELEHEQEVASLR